MAFHITKSTLGKSVYYKGGTVWTDVYADRKSYVSNALAQADIDEMSSPIVNGISRPKVSGTIVEE
jgi:multisubunit Na+/H+ antiporter MnhE subunit